MPLTWINAWQHFNRHEPSTASPFLAVPALLRIDCMTRLCTYAFHQTDFIKAKSQPSYIGSSPIATMNRKLLPALATYYMCKQNCLKQNLTRWLRLYYRHICHDHHVVTLSNHQGHLTQCGFCASHTVFACCLFGKAWLYILLSLSMTFSLVYREMKATDMKYRNRIRSRISNLKDPKNPSLRRNVLCGIVSTQNIATMTAEVTRFYKTKYIVFWTICYSYEMDIFKMSKE